MQSGMLRTLTLASIVLAAVTAAAAQQRNAPATTAAPPLRLTSTAFSDSTPIPRKYTCAAQPAAVSPPLEWSNVPKDTASFVLIVHDPEPRPRKGVEDVLHWLVWNLPADARQLPEGVPPKPELPDGARQGKNQSGQIGYRGPCAPPGISHHYMFELFALDIKPDLPAGSTRADVRKAMDGHVVGHALLIGLFHR